MKTYDYSSYDLSQIAKFKNQFLLIKLGGSLASNKEALLNITSQVAFLKSHDIHPVIVHGAGSEISTWQEKLGIETKFIEGLRYTCPKTAELAEMLLCGKVQNIISSLINDFGGSAIGLSGKDANLFTLKKTYLREKDDLGQVGEVTSVNFEAIIRLCQAGFIPVIGSIGGDASGNTLNINADTLAGEIASAIKASEMYSLTNVAGILKDDAVISSITLQEAQALLEDPAITSGMIPKLSACIQALKGGANLVKIISGSEIESILKSLLQTENLGTTIQ